MIVVNFQSVCFSRIHAIICVRIKYFDMGLKQIGRRHMHL